MQNAPPPVFTILRCALKKADDYPFGYALYVPRDEPWGLDTRCALLDPNDVESDDQDDPLLAQERGLGYALDYGTVQEILHNLKQQVATPGDALLLEAFLHYYDNDALIEVPREKRCA